MNETTAPHEDADPIDAEFEPSASDNDTPTLGAAPGWVAFGLLGLVSLTSLAFAILASGIFSGQDRTSTAESDSVSGLIARLEQAEADSATLQSTVSGLSDRLSQLETETRQLASASARLDDMVAEGATGTGVPASVLSRIERLESRISALASSAGSGIGSADVASIESRLAELESRSPDVRTEDTGPSADIAALALMSISTEAARGRPFLLGYQQLRAALPGDRRISGIEAYARTGVPTRDQLEQDFARLREEALAQERSAANVEPGWVDQVFGDSVRVRRTSATPLSDTLTAAGTALEDGDLNEAITALDALGSANSEPFEGWIQSAQDRIDLDQRLDTIRLAVMSRAQP